MLLEPTGPLKCNNLQKTFGGVNAINNLSVSFQAGKVTALVGPNGAGKTTLFHLISGTLRPNSGEIWFGNQRLDNVPAWRVSRLGVNRMFQDTRIFPNLSVLQNVLVAFNCQMGENPMWALLRRTEVSKQERQYITEALHWIQLVGLEVHEAVLAGELSLGQQKLLATARLLASGAGVLLLDEPLAGVAPSMVTRLVLLIRELANNGRTVVVIEHNIRAVMDFADEVCYLERGHVKAVGSPDNVLRDPGIRAAFLGL